MSIITSLYESLAKIPKIQQLYSNFGKYIDRQTISWAGYQSTRNSDPIDYTSQGERYFKASVNPHVKAGLLYSDASRLFVSARGLDPDEFGSYYPPQLGYTSPEEGDDEQLDRLAYQYDEQFDGGFQPILKSLQDPAMIYGRAIGEIEWDRDEKGFYSPFIWSRDPQEFILFPYDLPPGIYRKKHAYSTGWSGDLVKMPPGKFMIITHDPLFNNSYGQSLLRSIIKLIETWQGTGTGYEDDANQQGIFDAWREGMKKAGFGMWLASFDNSIAGNDNRSIEARETLLAGVKKLGIRIAGIFHENANIRSEKLELDSAAFMDFYTMYVQSISILLCGSATALIEGKYGSYAKEESTTVREKSIREQMNASMLSLAFTYQFNRFWLHYNYGQNAKGLPQLQLIPPERIMPTTPEGQETQTDEEEVKEEIAIDNETQPEEEIETPVEFQEGEKEEEKEAKPVVDFPSDLELPDVYKSVQTEAREILLTMGVYEKQKFDRLPEEQKSSAFTIAALRNNVRAMSMIKDAIAETLNKVNETEAWAAFSKQFATIRQRLSLSLSLPEVMTAFRYARQSAYSKAVDKMIDDKVGVHAIVLKTQEDYNVRPTHKHLANVARLASDKWVRDVKFPLSFNCRCYKQPMTQQEFDASKLTLTPDNKLPDLKAIERF